MFIFTLEGRMLVEGVGAGGEGGEELDKEEEERRLYVKQRKRKI